MHNSSERPLGHLSLADLSRLGAVHQRATLAEFKVRELEEQKRVLVHHLEQLISGIEQTDHQDLHWLRDRAREAKEKTQL